MWKAMISKVVELACVGYGPMGWPLRASIESTDHVLDIWNLVNRCSMSLNRCSA
jgi:hypothetical protein